MSITVEQLDNLCRSIAASRAHLEGISATKKAAEEQLDKLESQLLDMFEKLEKTTYPSPVGTFTISHRTSIKLPQGEEKEKFFQYLKDKGIFEGMATVHSATLNSFYKAELEAALERGEGLDFSLPGLGLPTINKTISFRAAK